MPTVSNLIIEQMKRKVTHFATNRFARCASVDVDADDAQNCDADQDRLDGRHVLDTGQQKKNKNG
jgi:hypothetical protein